MGNHAQSGDSRDAIPLEQTMCIEFIEVKARMLLEICESDDYAGIEMDEPLVFALFRPERS